MQLDDQLYLFIDFDRDGKVGVKFKKSQFITRMGVKAVPES
jgi:hypothetical protein